MRTVLTDPPSPARSARGYVLRAVATGLGLFGLLRLPWVESNVILPLTRLQGDVAAAVLGTPAAPISVTLACSGTEVIAMCLGAVLAYPVRWQARIVGAVAMVTGILLLNTLRIGTLGMAAAHPRWFDPLHLYVWPTLLMVATAAAVFWWMRRADRATPVRVSPSWQFAGLALLLITLSALAAPWYVESAVVGHIGTAIAGASAVLLGSAGATVHATGQILWTTRGGYSVTADCVATPLLPVYLAAVWVYAPTWTRLALGTLSAAPVFFVLGVVRLLLVALPPTFTSTPEVATHAFYQVVLAGVVVVLAGRWRHGTRDAIAPVAAGLVVGVGCVMLAGAFYTSLVMPVNRPFLDPQGAVAFLPSFQVGLYVALWLAALRHLRWTRPAVGLAVLITSHVVWAWWITSPGVAALLATHISGVRAWAVAGPLLILWGVVTSVRAPAPLDHSACSRDTIS